MLLSSSMVGDDDRSNDDRNALALWLMVVRVVGQGEVGLLGHLKDVSGTVFFVVVRLTRSRFEIPRGFAKAWKEETEP